MKIEEFERLKEGQRLLDNISGYKSLIEDIEQGLENKDQIEKGVMFTDGEKLRIPLTKEMVLNTIEMALKDYRANVARLEKEFEEL